MKSSDIFININPKLADLEKIKDWLIKEDKEWFYLSIQYRGTRKGI